LCAPAFSRLLLALSAPSALRPFGPSRLLRPSAPPLGLGRYALQEKKQLAFEGTIDGSAAALSQLTGDDLAFLFQN
jgi:hypothetical protein